MRTFAQTSRAPRQNTTLPLATFSRRSFGQGPDIHSLPRVARTIVHDSGQPRPQANAADHHRHSASEPVINGGHDFRRIRVYAEAPPALDPHLMVSSPGVTAERTAATEADQALSMPEPRFQRAYGCGGGCPSTFQPTEMRRQEIPGSTGTAPAEDHAIKGETCEWREPIDKGVISAKERVDRALAMLSPLMEGQALPPTIETLLREHFHTTDLELVKQIAITYAAIRVALEAAVPFFCVDSKHDACSTEKGYVMAATRCAPDAEIAICGQYFFVAGDVGRAQTLIHEFAHHVPGLCKDHAYTHEAAYKTLKPEQAIKNPDSYATFASTLP